MRSNLAVCRRKNAYATSSGTTNRRCPPFGPLIPYQNSTLSFRMTVNMCGSRRKLCRARCLRVLTSRAYKRFSGGTRFSGTTPPVVLFVLGTLSRLDTIFVEAILAPVTTQRYIGALASGTDVVCWFVLTARWPLRSCKIRQRKGGCHAVLTCTGAGRRGAAFRVPKAMTLLAYDFRTAFLIRTIVGNFFAKCRQYFKFAASNSANGAACSAMYCWTARNNVNEYPLPR